MTLSKSFALIFGCYSQSLSIIKCQWNTVICSFIRYCMIIGRYQQQLFDNSINQLLLYENVPFLWIPVSKLVVHVVPPVFICNHKFWYTFDVCSLKTRSPQLPSVHVYGFPFTCWLSCCIVNNTVHRMEFLIFVINAIWRKFAVLQDTCTHIHTG